MGACLCAAVLVLDLDAVDRSINQPRSDAAAAALIDRMMQAMGGRDVWARATSLYVVEEAHSLSTGGPVRTVFYRDLERPRIRWETTGTDGTRVTAITADGGWQRTGTTVSRLPPARVASFTTLWPRLVYTLYHRFAGGDPRLTVIMDGERRMTIRDDGSVIGWIEFDHGAHVVRWTAMADGQVMPGEEWIYGPPRAFGPISMPTWGTRVDGSYRFAYLEVVPSSERYPDALFAS